MEPDQTTLPKRLYDAAAQVQAAIDRAAAGLPRTIDLNMAEHAALLTEAATAFVGKQALLRGLMDTFAAAGGEGVASLGAIEDAIIVKWHISADGERKVLLGEHIRSLRTLLADLRGKLKGGAKPVLLMRIFHTSEAQREAEAALRKIIHEAVEGEDVRDLNYTQARCPRCHHPAPAVSAWGRMGRLILFHDAGSMTCSGVGEQVPR